MILRVQEGNKNNAMLTTVPREPPVYQRRRSTQNSFTQFSNHIANQDCFKRNIKPTTDPKRFRTES